MSDGWCVANVEIRWDDRERVLRSAIGAFLDAMGRFSFDEFPRDWPEMWRMTYSSREIQWRLRRHFPGNAFFDRVFHEELAFFKPLLPSAQKEHCRAYWELMRRVIGYSRRVLLRLGDCAATSLTDTTLQPVCIAEVGESVLQKLADVVGGGMRRRRPSRRGVVGSEGCRGRQTPFMARQREVFLEFLKIYPVTASVSRVTRARSCWVAHRTSWDEAAKRGDGYSGYKALANAKLA